MTGEIERFSEITRRGFAWARTGHPWVYRDDVATIGGASGDVVRVLHGGQCLGSAFLGTRSKIALRWIERLPDPRMPDEAFWRGRLERAIARREPLARLTDAYRVVHDAADGFPGVVLDRYGPVAVLQTTTPGAERLLPLLGDLARSLLGAESVVVRNDLTIRDKEGLPREKYVLSGPKPPLLWVHEQGPLSRIEFPVDPCAGQKTGAFLDQRQNRWRAAEYARGRFLDCFSHLGLFSLHAASRIGEATAVDSSEPALALAAEAAARNGVSNVRFVRDNAFDFLKEACGRGERYDTVVLDPPAFAKSRTDLPAAVRGYREINRRAMELLEPGGVLVTCSCSYNVSEDGFLDILRDAARDAKADFVVEERRTQAPDHPVILCHPESAYLKCAIVRKQG